MSSTLTLPIHGFAYENATPKARQDSEAVEVAEARERIRSEIQAMIACAGFIIWPTSTITYATASTSNYYPVNGTYFICPPYQEEPDPKRKIPFYRALFDQDFPQPSSPRIKQIRPPKWKPAMGRVRIDRSLPRIL